MLLNNNSNLQKYVNYSGVPKGCDALLLAELVEQEHSKSAETVLVITGDDTDMLSTAEAISFFGPKITVLTLSAWDCLPYDRVPPRHDIMAQRLATLSYLANSSLLNPTVVVTTAGAVLQKIPNKEVIAQNHFLAKTGDTIDTEYLNNYLVSNGYLRTETVREPSEYSVRGGIIDIFPPGIENPLRLDLFGDVLEYIRSFDALTQRTISELKTLKLTPANEIIISDGSWEMFRNGYREVFGPVKNNDHLFEAINSKIRHPGMEHWGPLFYESMSSIFDYVSGSVVLGLQAEEALAARQDLITEYYNARLLYKSSKEDVKSPENDFVYNPLPPDFLYISDDNWKSKLSKRETIRLKSFQTPDSNQGTLAIGGKSVDNFSEARKRQDINLLDAFAKRIQNNIESGDRVVISAYSKGSRDRMVQLLHDHGISDAICVDTWFEACKSKIKQIPIFVLGLETGFSVESLTIYSEKDILGDRLVRKARRTRRAENFIKEIGSLSKGDYVVHVEHGIGRFGGLETLKIGGAPHDCLRLLYANDDKLFLPVENLELLSRFGSQEAVAQVDRLGGASWQARRAKIKGKIKEIATELLRIAAERELKTGIKLNPPQYYQEFCSRFSFTETEDQARAINETNVSLSSGRPMDRLICGDVGFGKTEVALRAAFIASLNGFQVAVVVPTTLLARQHFKTFFQRFEGFPVNIRQLSRLISKQESNEVKAGLADGTIDIVIGTHTLLGKSIEFKDLALLIIDEEQHFGVTQKEQLKKLRSDVHVLTLSATPIPRTLQLALTGVRELSLIATPPIDRLSVRTFVLPYDPVSIREAILREHFRGGQTFYVCPRIDDIPIVFEKLEKLVPEIKVIIAHGQMAPTVLEDVMSSFYDGNYEVLLCTNIIESGLDLPSANTIIIHRADMFGLSQLYQLRGRVGRAKVRAYAYLTLPSNRTLTEAARKRLDVMQTLDTLGAGFSLASHDLDIRGAGNLLGEEQTGHIREVGVELYQQMLEEAVAAERDNTTDDNKSEDWTPVITLGTPILIPDSYVSDLGLRLSLYRRIATLVEPTDIDGFAAESIDRFGPLPIEMDNLLQLIKLKKLCHHAGVEKLDVGPKGAVISFKENTFSNPEALINFISDQAGKVRVRPDQKLVYHREWSDEKQRLIGVRSMMLQLSKLAVVVS